MRKGPFLNTSILPHFHDMLLRGPYIPLLVLSIFTKAQGSLFKTPFLYQAWKTSQGHFTGLTAICIPPSSIKNPSCQPLFVLFCMWPDILTPNTSHRNIRPSLCPVYQSYIAANLKGRWIVLLTCRWHGVLWVVVRKQCGAIFVISVWGHVIRDIDQCCHPPVIRNPLTTPEKIWI